VSGYNHDKNYTPEEQKIREEILGKSNPADYEVISIESRQFRDFGYETATLRFKNGSEMPTMVRGNGKHDDNCTQRESDPLLNTLSSCMCRGEKYNDDFKLKFSMASDKRPIKSKGRWSKD
jgi:hypothetical protein